MPQGIMKDKGEGVDHVVSVVGWGTDPKAGMAKVQWDTFSCPRWLPAGWLLLDRPQLLG